MNEIITTAIPDVIFHLEKYKSDIRSAFLGFDACIDILVRVVKEKNGSDITGYFTNSSQFGEFLVDLNNKSCGLELKTKLSKIGGNMVITANALGNLDFTVECSGTFGLPDILPVFHTMSPNCKLHSIGETISATALEFNNSKVIMFDPGPYNNLTWTGVRDILGVENLQQMLEGKKLIAFLNWSEIENTSQIWEGILDEVLPKINFHGERPFFFADFSDCSRKSKEDIKAAIKLLKRFAEYFKVIISLNQNEADLISNALEVSRKSTDEEFLKDLYKKVCSDVVIVHRTQDAIAFNGIEYRQCATFFCDNPKILTGGGDNFNAGFCYSLFNDLDLFQSLLVANAVSGSYVKSGVSPGITELIAFLKEYH